MKIAICVNHYYPSIGGAEKVAQRIAEFLASKHEVYVFTRHMANRKSTTINGVNILEYKPNQQSLFMKRLLGLSPEVVFIYSDVFDFFTTIIKERRGWKLIIALCGANWIYRNRINHRKFFAEADHMRAVICHSTVDRDYQLCSSPLVKNKLVVIPNGVDLQEFDVERVPRENLFPGLSSKKWILNVSNFFPGKGQEYLVEILSRMPNPEEYVYLQVCSDIPFQCGQALERKWKIQAERKLKKKGLHVEFVKNAKRDKVVSIFMQSNLFAFTSIKEVAPLVLLEAMAAGIPWVSMNVGNAAELSGGHCIKTARISKGVSIFDDRVLKLYLKHIAELIESPGIAKEGRREVEKRFNWDHILPKYGEIIES